MTPRDFCYWLQGYFELQGSNELTQEQVTMIKEHLRLVLSQPHDVPMILPQSPSLIPMILPQPPSLISPLPYEATVTCDASDKVSRSFGDKSGSFADKSDCFLDRKDGDNLFSNNISASC